MGKTATAGAITDFRVKVEELFAATATTVARAASS